MKAATSKDVDELLDRHDTVEAALASGALVRDKLHGQWLYLTDGFTLVDALRTAQTAVELALDEWFMNPGRFLFGLALRELPAGEFERSTLTLLVHELCFRRELGGLPLLTQARQPYLAFYRNSDSDEVGRQVDALTRQLAHYGRVGWRDLPEPRRHVPRKVWRNTVISHGEWLGLGWQPEPGQLHAW